MVTNKRKKVTKYRGHTTHGGGHRKKRRGAGSRGGRGRAGTGKRAGHKKAGGMVISGKHGFRARRMCKKIKTINVGDLTQLLDQKDGEVLDLGELGYQKLLGTGNIDVKLKIKVSSYSLGAEEKVKAAGGELVSSEPKREKKTREKKTEE